MVKGVNKTIIEINNTGSKYFDRVLLFVNPAHRTTPMPFLEHKADEFIKNTGVPDFSVKKTSRKNHKAVLFFGIAAIIAAAVIAFILII